MQEPTVRPDTDSLRRLGIAQQVYNLEFKPACEGVTFIGDDVLIHTAEITLPPGSFTEAQITIPFGYLKGLVPLEHEPYLLDSSVIGTPIFRSRLCQAGLYAYRVDPLMNRCPDIEIRDGYYIMNIILHNRHPINSLHFSGKDFEAARLAIFPPAVHGMQLYEMAKTLGNSQVKVIGLSNVTGQDRFIVYSLDELSMMSPDEISQLNLISISLSIEKQSLLQNEGRQVDPEIILSEATVDRKSESRYDPLYEYLGVEWEAFSEEELRRLLTKRRVAQLVLLSTVHVNVPKGYVLKTINPTHAPATLVDQGYRGGIVLELPVMFNAHELDELGLSIGEFTFFVYRA